MPPKKRKKLPEKNSVFHCHNIYTVEYSISYTGNTNSPRSRKKKMHHVKTTDKRPQTNSVDMKTRIATSKANDHPQPGKGPPPPPIHKKTFVGRHDLHTPTTRAGTPKRLCRPRNKALQIVQVTLNANPYTPTKKHEIMVISKASNIRVHSCLYFACRHTTITTDNHITKGLF